MGVSSVSAKNRYILWGKTAGRCQYEGCNEELNKDPTTQAEFNQAYVAHIIADKPGGPRGHASLSEELKDDISNLMLLCDRHHRLIDKEAVDEHPVERLRAMKKTHEERIALAANIAEEKNTHVILFGARIGEHGFPLTYKEAVQAIFPEYYPTSNSPIEIGIDTPHQDEEDDYWKIQDESLVRNFDREMGRIKEKSNDTHFSVFGLAPQPLLIRLGTLLSDIYTVEVYTRSREPATWKWMEDAEPLEFEIIPPRDTDGTPVLNVSITADISRDRIESVIGEDSSIWKLTVLEPGKDLIRSRETLRNFRTAVRKVFEQIKVAHGQSATVHVLPAMPNSTSIELGRVWMPKAELPMIIYDQNSSRNGFIKTITISKPHEVLK